MNAFELKLKDIIIDHLEEGGYDETSIKKAAKELIDILRLKEYYNSIQVKYNDWRNYDGMPEEANGLSYAIEKFEELKLDTL